MASSDSNAETTTVPEADDESNEAKDAESLELGPDEVFEMNSSAEEAFSPE